MTTITIPKKITTEQELVAVPRRLYEEFLTWQEMIKSKKTFKPSLSEKRAILRGRREISEGKYITLEDLSYELANQNFKQLKKKS